MFVFLFGPCWSQNKIKYNTLLCHQHVCCSVRSSLKKITKNAGGGAPRISTLKSQHGSAELELRAMWVRSIALALFNFFFFTMKFRFWSSLKIQMIWRPRWCISTWQLQAGATVHTGRGCGSPNSPPLPIPWRSVHLGHRLSCLTPPRHELVLLL